MRMDRWSSSVTSSHLGGPPYTPMQPPRGSSLYSTVATSRVLLILQCSHLEGPLYTPLQPLQGSSLYSTVATWRVLLILYCSHLDGFLILHCSHLEGPPYTPLQPPGGGGPPLYSPVAPWRVFLILQCSHLKGPHNIPLQSLVSTLDSTHKYTLLYRWQDSLRYWRLVCSLLIQYDRPTCLTSQLKVLQSQHQVLVVQQYGKVCSLPDDMPSDICLLSQPHHPSRKFLFQSIQ